MKKVLIIEDDPNIIELEKDYLELSNFDVTVEPDGAEGEKRAMSGEFDLLILDIVLPGADGFEICRNFRKKYLTPVIIVSAKNSDTDKVHGLGLGADDYITKPFSPSELVARVKAHIRRHEELLAQNTKNEKKNEIITAGDIRIDKTARRVFVCGQEQQFTTKEFNLLYHLATHPDCVFSKEALFEIVWGTDVGDIATVTVHIRKIRKKLEKNSSGRQYIETVWGTGGYRFRGENI